MIARSGPLHHEGPAPRPAFDSTTLRAGAVVRPRHDLAAIATAGSSGTAAGAAVAGGASSTQAARRAHRRWLGQARSAWLRGSSTSPYGIAHAWLTLRKPAGSRRSAMLLTGHRRPAPRWRLPRPSNTLNDGDPARCRRFSVCAAGSPGHLAVRGVRLRLRARRQVRQAGQESPSPAAGSRERLRPFPSGRPSRRPVVSRGRWDHARRTATDSVCCRPRRGVRRRARPRFLPPACVNPSRAGLRAAAFDGQPRSRHPLPRPLGQTARQRRGGRRRLPAGSAVLRGTVGFPRRCRPLAPCRKNVTWPTRCSSTPPIRKRPGW